MAPAIADHIYITLFLGDAVLLCPLFRSDMIVPPHFESSKSGELDKGEPVKPHVDAIWRVS